MVKPPALSHLTTPALPSFDFLRKRNEAKQKSFQAPWSKAKPKVGSTQTASDTRYLTQSPKSPKSPGRFQQNQQGCFTPFSSISDSKSFNSTGCTSIVSTGTTGPFSSAFERVPGGWRPLSDDPIVGQADPEPWTWPHIAARKKSNRRGAWGIEKLGQRHAVHKFALRGGDSALMFIDPNTQVSAGKRHTLTGPGDRERSLSLQREMPASTESSEKNFAATAPAALKRTLQPVTEDTRKEDVSGGLKRGSPDHKQSEVRCPIEARTDGGSARLSQQGVQEVTSTMKSTHKPGKEKPGKDGQEPDEDASSESSEVFEGGLEEKPEEEAKQDKKPATLTRSSTKNMSHVAKPPVPNPNLLQAPHFDVNVEEARGTWGIDAEQLAEYKELFLEFDVDNTGTINLNELRSMFRNLGHHPPPRLVYEILCAASDHVKPEDDNGSIEMDFRQFLCSMDLLNKQEAEISHNLFVTHDTDDSGELNLSEMTVLLESLGYKPSPEMVKQIVADFDVDGNGVFSYDEFFDLVKQYRQIEKQEVRKRCGFTQDEVMHYQEAFNMYDRDRSGEVSFNELLHVVRDCNMMPKTREQQRKLQSWIEDADRDNSGTLTFEEFLILIRKFWDHDECEQYAKERRAATACGFTEAEVLELREIFDTLLQEGEVPELTIFSIKQLLRSLGASLAPAQMQELKRIFERFAQQVGEKRENGLTLPFPEFLMLMKDLLKKDFAGLQEAAKRTTNRRELEKKNMEDLMKKVQEQKRVRASTRSTQPRGTWAGNGESSRRTLVGRASTTGCMDSLDSAALRGGSSLESLQETDSLSIVPEPFEKSSTTPSQSLGVKSFGLSPLVEEPIQSYTEEETFKKWYSTEKEKLAKRAQMVEKYRQQNMKKVLKTVKDVAAGKELSLGGFGT
eukprot:gnl/MRDRNA2_/MRDRNA2_95457_c0_seq1.p1 gnl/MRDRNA2_/MRDRNA2_95457_c0~~gnl/MRDRNA2_/MRDRNA2_95457_c0_seq1.p1  ORF type:complete len:903 (-),score=185.03 gnl/MRDRNA2_/MRDRNA2_95457_c0_seq1:272-2980(-)